MTNDVQADGSGEVRLSEAAEAKLKEIAARYPSSKSAVMAALYLAQEELGWLKPEAYSWVSQRLAIPLAHVREVATFYTMYYKEPVGTYHIQICRTLSCFICGGKNITGYIKQRLGLNGAGMSQDRFWSFEEVECLGSCGTAPMVQINDVFFEKLDVETLGRIMDQIEQEKPDLRYSTVKGGIGGTLQGHPFSAVWDKVAGNRE